MHADSIIELTPWQPNLFSLALYTIMVFGLVGVLLFLSGWLGEKKENPEKIRPYECGIIPTGAARLHQPVPFYLVAVFFLIFDVEAIFIFAWSVAFLKLGLAGWLQMSFFIVVLLISLFYIWKKRGLDWGPKPRMHRRNPKTSS